MTDDLTLVVNGANYDGWTDVRVTRSCERFPTDFAVRMTQKSPTGGAMIFEPFQTCKVMLGKDLVMTGYIDALDNTLSKDDHSIVVAGRSNCEDLVDCSGEFLGAGGVNGVPTMGHTNGNVFTIAKSLCEPYKLAVKLQMPAGQTLTNVPAFRINPGETGYEIIERFAKFQGILVYDDTDGNLILSTIGYSEMASGFEVGKNIEEINVSQRFDQRYSVIDVFDQTVYSQAPGSGAVGAPAEVFDQGIKRHRRLITISEAPYTVQLDWKQRRAQWELNRRVGRSQVIRITTDSWRDKAGKLWQPNSYVTVDAPYMGIAHAKWIISEVTYSKSMHRGTTAHLVIMPPLAFSVEPTVVTGLDAALSVGLPKTASNGLMIGPV